jgi:RimJ/RimL family protein N-acetyltransferase
LAHNPNNGHPWLGLLIIHMDEQGLGYGKAALAAFATLLKSEGKTDVRIGVFINNPAALQFWEAAGFCYYDAKMSNLGVVVNCLEKRLS